MVVVLFIDDWGQRQEDGEVMYMEGPHGAMDVYLY
jgi:hypothetical protein